MQAGIVRGTVILGLLGCRATPDPALVEPLPDPVFATLPVRDLAAAPRESEQIQADLQAALEARGASFVPVEAVEEILRRDRIRYTDSIAPEAATRIGAETGAGFVLITSVLDYVPGPDPRIAVSSRVVDAVTGIRVRSSVVSLRGGDFTGLFELGTIYDPVELAEEVIARLALQLDPRVEAPPPEDAGGLPRFLSGARMEYFFRDPGFDPREVRRIAVLPPFNRTDRLFTGDLVGDVIADQFYQLHDVQVVERVHLLSAMYRERLRSIQHLDLDILRRIGEDVGTRYFVRGMVNEYTESVYVEKYTFPEIEIGLHVIDVERGTVVAAALVRRRGDDDHILLGLGHMFEPVSLVRRAARDLVEAVIG